MKKVFAILISSLLISLGTYAQDQMGVFSLAGNLNYGTKIESLGVGLRAQYGIHENARLSGEYKYYVDRHNLSAWLINADAHYVFSVSDAVSLYPIGGLSYSRWTFDPKRSYIGELPADIVKIEDDRLGLNIGFGGQIKVGEKTYIQIEMKEALIKGFTQFETCVGFMYQF